MKKLFLGLLFLSLIVGAGYITSQRLTDSSTTRLIDSATKYQCPMHHEIIRNQPGQCPICGMTLVLIKKQTSTEPQNNGIQISKSQEQLLGVQITEVQMRPLHLNILATGTVAHDPELYLAIEDYQQTLKNYETLKNPQIKTLLETSRVRLMHLGLTTAMIEQLGAEDHSSLLMSHSGSILWIYAQIYESEAGQVKVGQGFEVSLPSDSTKKWQGVIQSIDTFVDPQTRTLKIRGQIKDTSGTLRPDMYVNVAIGVSQGQRLAVPVDAVFDTGLSQTVFVKTKSGEFTQRKVSVGIRGDDAVEITSGLKAGEKVAVGANFLLDSESKLRTISQ
jgi:Cu(I)/Ag(I) efflux system membrane fusion protein